MLLTTILTNIEPFFLLYTDPGSGALLLQLFIAAIFGGLFYIRRIKDKFMQIIGKKAVTNEDSSYVSDKPS